MTGPSVKTRARASHSQSRAILGAHYDAEHRHGRGVHRRHLDLRRKATIVGSYVGAYIIGMIEAGLVATGMQGFWVRAVVGLVFLAVVIFHLTVDEPQRLARLKHSFGLRLRASPMAAERGDALRRGSSD